MLLCDILTEAAKLYSKLGQSSQLFRYCLSHMQDKSIYCLFKFLQVDKIINLFEAILL